MSTIHSILAQYRPKIASLDLELLIAHELKKSREFVLAHPEFQLTKKQETRNKQLIARRLHHEPLAHILGHKEFYGLDFQVTPETLIPRPETELLVEQALQKIQDTRNKKQRISVVDVGTGSGNIIISIAKTIEDKKLLHASGCMLYGIDISKNALQVAKHNAKKNKVNKKINFLHGNLLDPILKNTKYQIPARNAMPSVAGGPDASYIILANLPYLSKEIYSATAPDVKNFEPKSALYSPQRGLAHYEKLLKQIRNLKDAYYMLHATCFLELSPEQKKDLGVLVKKILPSAKIQFEKDLAGKWRVCMISLA